MTGDPPQPRLCHIRKVADFDGYGFNLHAEKNKPGQFVGKIDPGSPAEIAGLKEGDREAAVIIAVLSLSLYCHVLILPLSWLIQMTENNFLQPIQPFHLHYEVTLN